MDDFTLEGLIAKTNELRFTQHVSGFVVRSETFRELKRRFPSPEPEMWRLADEPRPTFSDPRWFGTPIRVCDDPDPELQPGEVLLVLQRD